MAFTTTGSTLVPIPASITQQYQNDKTSAFIRPFHYNMSQSGGRQYAYITTATTTNIATAERLCKLHVVSGTMGAITIYDNPSGASGNVLYTITTSVAGVYDLQIPTQSAGLTIVTGAATNVAVTYE